MNLAQQQNAASIKRCEFLKVATLDAAADDVSLQGRRRSRLVKEHMRTSGEVSFCDHNHQTMSDYIYDLGTDSVTGRKSTYLSKYCLDLCNSRVLGMVTESDPP
jgi:hypothetical protein